MPWAQGVGRSNRPAPTNKIMLMWAFPGCPKIGVDKNVAVAFPKIQQSDSCDWLTREDGVRFRTRKGQSQPLKFLCNYFFLNTAVSRKTQPAINIIPPSGVTGPITFTKLLF